MTRRKLLAVTAASTAANIAASAAPLWARPHWDRSRISAITDEIGANADDAATFAHDAGMLFVEVRNQPGTNREYASAREADMKATATHLANENLKISVVNTSLLNFTWPGGPAAPDQARWDRRMDDLQKALRCAQIMGTDKLRIFAGTRVADPSSMLPRTADVLAEMAAEAEKQKVTLLLENHPDTNVASCAELAAAMKLVPSKWVGVNWQPAPDGYALLPKKRILNVRVPAASLTPGRPETMNWRAILTSLDKDGYSGHITLEMGPGKGPGKDMDAARDALDQLVHIVREVS